MPRGKGRKKKDPNAPKRACSAYLFYASAIRPAVKEEFPDLSFGETQKKIAEKYKELTEDEKSKYEDMAATDRQRYEREMENYTPPSDDSDSDSDSDSDVPKRKKRKKKDPNAPKRASSAYMFFVKENRAKVKEENPDLSFGELGKLMGEKYRNLTEEEKKPYLEAAEQDKERSKRETEAYNNAKNQYVSDEEETSDEDSDSD